jgi:uncharacterized protein YunC (DUF1805 family)
MSEQKMLGDELCCGPNVYEGFKIPTGKANLLMIRAEHGFLGCGYFNVEVANKIGEAVAIVTGVKDYSDMLAAKVVSVSSAASMAGVNIGMNGDRALELLQIE